MERDRGSKSPVSFQPPPRGANKIYTYDVVFRIGEANTIPISQTQIPYPPPDAQTVLYFIQYSIFIPVRQGIWLYRDNCNLHFWRKPTISRHSLCATSRFCLFPRPSLPIPTAISPFPHRFPCAPSESGTIVRAILRGRCGTIHSERAARRAIATQAVQTRRIRHITNGDGGQGCFSKK